MKKKIKTAQEEQGEKKEQKKKIKINLK